MLVMMMGKICVNKEHLFNCVEVCLSRLTCESELPIMRVEILDKPSIPYFHNYHLSNC